MDKFHTMEERREVFKDFCQKMSDSGYEHSTRMEVAKSALKIYYRQILEQESGGRRMFRGSREMAEGRRLKQHLNKTWYKSSRGGKDVTSAKDLPWTSQEEEKEGRKSYWKTARNPVKGIPWRVIPGRVILRRVIPGARGPSR